MMSSWSRRAAMITIGSAIAAPWLALAAAQEQLLTDAAGTITVVNASQGWFGIVRVVFSGKAGPINPNARAWGIPLALTKIRVE
jgi:hypothetical protein